MICMEAKSILRTLIICHVHYPVLYDVYMMHGSKICCMMYMMHGSKVFCIEDFYHSSLSCCMLHIWCMKVTSVMLKTFTIQYSLLYDAYDEWKRSLLCWRLLPFSTLMLYDAYDARKQSLLCWIHLPFITLLLYDAYDAWKRSVFCWDIYHSLLSCCMMHMMHGSDVCSVGTFTIQYSPVVWCIWCMEAKSVVLRTLPFIYITLGAWDQEWSLFCWRLLPFIKYSPVATLVSDEYHVRDPTSPVPGPAVTVCLVKDVYNAHLHIRPAVLQRVCSLTWEVEFHQGASGLTYIWWCKAMLSHKDWSLF